MMVWGPETAKKGLNDPKKTQNGVDLPEFDRFSSFLAVFYGFRPTSHRFFRHRADIFLFFWIFRL